MHHDLHKHDFFFILAIQHGRGSHEIDFVRYPVQDETFFMLRPGQVHRLILESGTTGFVLEFNHSFYPSKNALSGQRWRKVSTKNMCPVKKEEYQRLHLLMTEMQSEYTARQEGYQEAIQAWLDLLFIALIRQSPDPGRIDDHTGGYTAERFEALTGLLEANIGRVKNVTAYAQALNVTPYQLNRITKASVGKTVSTLINEQIILEAKRNLLATQNQVKDIADELGYEDVSYFIRLFKRHTGYSPESFRKRFR